MKRLVPLVPVGVVASLIVATAGGAAHLSMDMPGLRGAVVSPPSLLLLVVTAIAALLEGLWLLRRSPFARDAAWALALAPLAVSAVRAHAVGEPENGVVALGSATSEHMWALLAAVALSVGFGAARVVEAALEVERRDRRSASPRVGAAFVAALLTLPFVGLILRTSTGIDWTSSWIRWGGCGIALVVCVGGALAPDRGEGRALGIVTFAQAAVLSLFAEREYVEALGHDALAHRALFAAAGADWVRGLQQIASAVEPRERYGPIAALLPALLLVRGTVWRYIGPRVTLGFGVLAADVLFTTAIASQLDVAGAAPPVSESAGLAAEQEAIDWSKRVLPRTARWLETARAEAHCRGRYTAARLG